MNIEIPDNWLPTSENINALPRPLLDLFMRLHANTDPAGELQRAMIAEMERDALRKMMGNPIGFIAHPPTANSGMIVFDKQTTHANMPIYTEAPDD